MNKEYYIVLHGAKKNVGDFLIRDRAKKLLSFIREDRNLIEYPSWKSLDNNLEEVNNSKAIIIMGGPGISSNVYPNVFPLATNLDDIKVPIILLGTGSYVYPLSYIYKYKLSDDSKKFINKCKFVSVRDNTTKNILLSNGIKNVVMTGCPAWYDINELDKDLNIPRSLNNIVLSTPQKKVFFPQFIELVKKIKNNFPNSNLIITFNRGYKEDKYTNSRESRYMTYYFDILNKMDLKIVDLSSDLDKFLSHLEYDIHIGYRLHTHINFISNKKPSYLLSEDSRSYGHCKTLSLPIFRASKDSLIESLLPQLDEGLLKRVIMYFLPFVKLNDNVIDDLIKHLNYDISTNFSSFYGLDKKLNENYKQMVSFIKDLP